MVSARLTMLGCGGSLGTPNIAGRWGKCDPNNPKNRRMRTSAWVEFHGKKFLIDTSPDLRTQILHNNLIGQRPDAVLYTHAHADHCHGIDDLRSYFWPDKIKLPIYGAPDTCRELTERFEYMFKGNPSNELYQPILTAHPITEGIQQIAGVPVTVIEQEHGAIPSLGFRFGDFAYCTDFKRFSGHGLELLKGIKTWAVSVADWDTEHPSHAILPEIMTWIDYLQPQQVYLIHLNPMHDYDALCAQLPPYIRPAYDGLVIETA